MKKFYAALLIFALPALVRSQPDQKPLVFTHVTVIDATGAPAKSDQTIVITGDRIAALGKSGKVAVPKDAEVVDARGKFLIPGLWDMHVHAFDKNMFFPLFIANGITGIRDMFGPIVLIKQWRKEIEEGKLTGPRIVAAGPILDGPKPIWPGSIAVSNEAEGRQAVTNVKKGGSDFVKVYSLLPRDAYFAIADEAKRQGIPFAGHVPDSVSATEASDAGQKSIEHLTGVLLASSAREEELRKELLEGKRAGAAVVMESFLRYPVKALDSFSQMKADALAARFVKNGTWMAPTLTVLRAVAFIDDSNFRSDPRLKYISPFLKNSMWGENAFLLKSRTPEDNANTKRVFQKQMELVRAMRRRGVQFVAGTDTPNPYCFPGFSLHDELALLVKAGFTPMEALQTATRNPAQFLGRLDSLGTVEKGKIADLVLLEANPLEEISNTQKIAAVIVGGRLILKSKLEEMLAGVEAAANKK